MYSGGWRGRHALQAARDMIERNIPLLGVNKGTLGYLAEVDGDNMEEALTG